MWKCSTRCEGIVVWLKRSKAKHSCRKSENTRVAQCRTKELLDQRIPLHFCSLKMKLAWLMGLYRIAESGYISHLQQMVTFLMQDGKFGNFPPFGEKGIFWWRKNTLFYYIIFSHWFFFFPHKILCSGLLAASHFLWLCYWNKQDRLLKRPILFSTLLNLKDIHAQVSHSTVKLFWKEETGSYCMWIYQCLFTVSRIFKISQVVTWVSF